MRRPNNVVGENVFFIRKVEQLAEILGNQGIAMPKKMVVEGDEISFGEWNRIAACTGAELVNGSNLIRLVRSVKTEWEIAQLSLSAEIQSDVLRKVPSVYVKGMSDHEFSVEVEKLFRLAGCLGLFRIYGGTMEAYMGSILAGENACEPSPYDFALGGAGMHPSLPLGHNGGVLKEGQTVIPDDLLFGFARGNADSGRPTGFRAFQDLLPGKTLGGVSIYGGDAGTLNLGRGELLGLENGKFF